MNGAAEMLPIILDSPGASATTGTTVVMLRMVALTLELLS